MVTLVERPALMSGVIHMAASRGKLKGYFLAALTVCAPASANVPVNPDIQMTPYTSASLNIRAPKEITAYQSDVDTGTFSGLELAVIKCIAKKIVPKINAAFPGAYGDIKFFHNSEDFSQNFLRAIVKLTADGMTAEIIFGDKSQLEVIVRTHNPNEILSFENGNWRNSLYVEVGQRLEKKSYDALAACLNMH